VFLPHFAGLRARGTGAAVCCVSAPREVREEHTESPRGFPRQQGQGGANFLCSCVAHAPCNTRSASSRPGAPRRRTHLQAAPASHRRWLHFHSASPGCPQEPLRWRQRLVALQPRPRQPGRLTSRCRAGAGTAAETVARRSWANPSLHSGVPPAVLGTLRAGTQTALAAAGHQPCP
jgi:hypothetical protein